MVTHSSDCFPRRPLPSFTKTLPSSGIVSTDGDPIPSSPSSSPRRLLVLEEEEVVMVVGTGVPSINCSCSGTRAGRRPPSAAGVCSSTGAFLFPRVEGGAEGSGAVIGLEILMGGVVIGLEVLMVVVRCLRFEVDAQGAGEIFVVFVGRRRLSGSCDSPSMMITWDGSGDKRVGRSRIGQMAGECLCRFRSHVSTVYVRHSMRTTHRSICGCLSPERSNTNGGA